MDKLTPEQQMSIKKLSDVRLMAKLTQAGYSVEAIEAMDRATMLNALAELVSMGKDKLVKEVRKTGSYDVKLERKKLEFEMWKYEEEKKRLEQEAKSQREFEI